MTQTMIIQTVPSDALFQFFSLHSEAANETASLPKERIQTSSFSDLFNTDLDNNEIMLASQESLAKLWMTPEEDAAWAYLTDL